MSEQWEIRKKWTLWEEQLLSVAALNRVSYDALAEVFGVGRNSIAGKLYRLRHAHHQPIPLMRDVYAREFDDQITFRCPAEMYQAVKALVGPRYNMGAVIRDLIEWGLMAVEEGKRA